MHPLNIPFKFTYLVVELMLAAGAELVAVILVKSLHSDGPPSSVVPATASWGPPIASYV